MRFLILTQYFAPETGATQIRLAAFARELRARGHDVEIATALPNYPVGRIYDGYRGRFYVREEWGGEGIPVHRVWAYPAMGTGLRRMLNYASFAVTACFALARCRRPDYVFIESPPLTLSVAGTIAAALWRVPVILNVADLWPDSIRELGVMRDGPVLRVAGALERWAYRRATFVTAVTEGIRHALLGPKHVPAAKVLSLPNGVDTKLFCPGPPDQALVRELGWEGRQVFLYAGTLAVAHGLKVALDAMERLRDARPEVLLAIVGGGSERPALEAAARARGLANVRFYDPRPPEEIARWYRAAYAGIVCLRDLPLFEGTRPSKMFPALATGKPLVYSGAGEGARLLIAAGAGLVARPEDAPALSGAMARLAADPALAEGLGAAGRRFVAAELSWPALVGRWLERLGSSGAAALPTTFPAPAPMER